MGWDLVEPLTYTSSAGVGIVFMWYMMRNRGLEDSRNADILDYKIQEGNRSFHKKEGYVSTIDKFRKQMLMEQLELVNTEIQ